MHKDVKILRIAGNTSIVRQGMRAANEKRDLRSMQSQECLTIKGAVVWSKGALTWYGN